MERKMTKNDLRNKVVFHTTVDNTAMVGVAKKIGYNVGVYGWNWSAYSLHDYDGHEVIILIAYRNTVGLPIPKRLVDWFDNQRSDAKSYGNMRSLSARLAERLWNLGNRIERGE